MQFLLPNRNLLALVSAVESKSYRNCDIKSFIVREGISVPDLEKFVLFAIDLLLFDLFTKLLVTGSTIVVLSMFLFSAHLLFIDDPKLAL